MSPRRSVLDRYAEELDARAARLEPRPAKATAALAPRAHVSLVHRQTVELLDELLGMVTKEDGAPGMLLRTLRRMEPHLLEDFSTVNEAALVDFMHRLGRRMLAIGADQPAPPLLEPGPSNGSRPHLPPPA